MKIDWVKKLTSRKLWVSIVGFVTMMVSYFGFTDTQAEKLGALIMAGAIVLGYVLGEGLVDSSSAIAVKDEEEEEQLYSTQAIGFEVPSTEDFEEGEEDE